MRIYKTRTKKPIRDNFYAAEHLEGGRTSPYRRFFSLLIS
jgi:hypothetical protein